MWLSSASRFSAPVKQRGFKQPFNQRCPLRCEASNPQPAQSPGDKHRVINAVGGHTFLQRLTKKSSADIFTLFVLKLPQTRLSWFVRWRSKLCSRVACSSKGKKASWCVAFQPPTRRRTWWKVSRSVSGIVIVPKNIVLKILCAARGTDTQKNQSPVL